MNLLTYAFHPSSSPTVNHHAALYPLRQEIDDPIASKLNVVSWLFLIKKIKQGPLKRRLRK
jgi:hypothetical protein